MEGKSEQPEPMGRRTSDARFWWLEAQHLGGGGVSCRKYPGVWGWQTALAIGVWRGGGALGRLFMCARPAGGQTGEPACRVGPGEGGQEMSPTSHSEIPLKPSEALTNLEHQVCTTSFSGEGLLEWVLHKVFGRF